MSRTYLRGDMYYADLGRGVNNVKYEVVSSFKESGAGEGTEDLADKMKRLILTEDIKPRKK